MIPYLFVYGTLKRGQPNPVALYFHQHAEWVGEGRLQGMVKDVGGYPGAWYNIESNDFVEGEIFKMDHPKEVFKVLDEYEGIGSSFIEPHEYIRELCPISCNGEMIVCWVYLYNWS